MAVTTTFTSLSVLANALFAAPEHLDLSSWRSSYDEFFNTMKSGNETAFTFTPLGTASNTSIYRTGTVPGGSFTLTGSGLGDSILTGNLVLDTVNYLYGGDMQLGVIGSNTTNPAGIRTNLDTGALSGNFSSIGWADIGEEYFLTLSGVGPVNGTGNITVDSLALGHGGPGGLLWQLQGHFILNNNPASPTFLKVVSGNITSVDFSIGDAELHATGLNISAAAFYAADTLPEIGALLNLIFVGNNTHTADGDGQTLMGGGGNDTYDFGSFLPGTASELPNGGTDLVKVQHDYDLDDNIENATFVGAAGGSLTGNAIANKLIGSAGADTLVGGDGSDTMTGGGGNDAYYADVTGDKAIEAAGGGYDTLFALATQTAGVEIEALILGGAENINGTGNASNNIIQGNSGNNVLLGMAGADSIVGGDGNDKIDGGADGDTLEGGGGSANTLLGGAGNDVLVSDNKTDSIDGGAGVDTVVLNQGEGLTYTLGAATENLTFANLTDGSSGIGNALANIFISSAAAAHDNFSGLGGNDTYYLQGGDTVSEDTGGGIDLVVSTESFSLAGSANVENLRLVGAVATTGTGNATGNVLTSESGAHTLVGGGGNDTYNVQATDFITEDADSTTGGVDLVNASLANGETFNLALVGTGIENLTLLSLGAGTVGGGGNALNNKIIGSTIAGANNNLAGEEGNDTLIGGAGADTLDGCNDADSLVGGLGNDVYVFVFNNTAGTLALVTDAFTDAGGADGLIFENTGDAGAVNANTTISLAVAPLTALENVDVSMVELNGGAGGFVLLGNGAGNRLIGSVNADTLTGAAGNDTLIGGGGNDSVSGGAGDDYYVWDGVDPLPVESVGGGLQDIIEFSADFDYNVSGYTNFEGIVLNFAAVTGGHLNGTDGANYLGSIGGDHTLTGALGNDTYSVQQGDTIVEDDNLVGNTHRDLVIATLFNSGDYFNIVGIQVEDITLLFTGAGGDVNSIGNELNNKMTGAANAANGFDGGSGADTLIGSARNDTLQGNLGIDSLVGGLGNDRYYVLLKPVAIGALEDAIVDTGGIDTLFVDDQGTATSFTYTLLAALENINVNSMDSAIHAKITGNAANNEIVGNGGNNTLDGGAGADTMYGAAGNDLLLGGAGADTLAGGMSGADTLDGGLGDDTYFEMEGDDTYLMTHAGDSISMDESGGNDTVIVGATGNAAYLNITGGNSFLDNVSFTGTAGVFITGNAGINILKGGGGNDSINGGAGNDSMAGGAGNDTMRVDNAGDQVSDSGGTADTVIADVDGYVLANGSGIERLNFGNGAFDGTGNASANLITGNVEANRMLGGGGLDTMFGGAGNDTFVLDGIAAGRVVTILDYVQGVDHIGLDVNNVTQFDNLFGLLGVTLQNDFMAGSNPQLFYKGTTGQLYYDANGLQAGQATLLAVFAADHRPAGLTDADFVQFTGFS